MTQMLINPELPIRDLEWYKTRYNGLREDALNQEQTIENLNMEIKSYQKHIEVLQKQLDSAKDLIDTLWDTSDELSANGMNRIDHDE